MYHCHLDWQIVLGNACHYSIAPYRNRQTKDFSLERVPCRDQVKPTHPLGSLLFLLSWKKRYMIFISYSLSCFLDSRAFDFVLSTFWPPPRIYFFSDNTACSSYIPLFTRTIAIQHSCKYHLPERRIATYQTAYIYHYIYKPSNLIMYSTSVNLILTKLCIYTNVLLISIFLFSCNYIAPFFSIWFYPCSCFIKLFPVSLALNASKYLLDPREIVTKCVLIMRHIIWRVTSGEREFGSCVPG